MASEIDRNFELYIRHGPLPYGNRTAREFSGAIYVVLSAGKYGLGQAASAFIENTLNRENTEKLRAAYSQMRKNPGDICEIKDVDCCSYSLWITICIVIAPDLRISLSEGKVILTELYKNIFSRMTYGSQVFLSPVSGGGFSGGNPLDAYEPLKNAIVATNSNIIIKVFEFGKENFEKLLHHCSSLTGVTPK